MAKSLPHLQKTPTWWTWRDQDHRGSLTALHLLQYCRQNSWSLHTGCTCVLCWISAALGGPNSVAGTAKESNSIKNKQNLILLPKDLSILKRNVQIQWVTSYLKRKKGRAERCTFSSWILSSIRLDAVSWDLKREIVLVSSGSKMFPLSSRTTRSKPRILRSVQVTRMRSNTTLKKQRWQIKVWTALGSQRTPTPPLVIITLLVFLSQNIYPSPLLFPLKGKNISHVT